MIFWVEKYKYKFKIRAWKMYIVIWSLFSKISKRSSIFDLNCLFTHPARSQPNTRSVYLQHLSVAWVRAEGQVGALGGSETSSITCLWHNIFIPVNKVHTHTHSTASATSKTSQRETQRWILATTNGSPSFPSLWVTHHHRPLPTSQDSINFLLTTLRAEVQLISDYCVELLWLLLVERAAA